MDVKFECAKSLLGFAFPTLVSLVVAASEITKTAGARIATIALSFAIAFMGCGFLLRKTYPKICTSCLIFGAILTTLSVYSLLVSFLPSHLKIILVLCGVVPLIALVLLGWAYFRRENKMKVPEEGELVEPERIICSDGKESNTRRKYDLPHHPLFHEPEQELMEQTWKRREREEEERIMNEFLASRGDVCAVGEAGVVDEESERIVNEFLALGMFSLIEEAEFMKKKEIVMNFIPESGASSSSSSSTVVQVNKALSIYPKVRTGAWWQ